MTLPDTEPRSKTVWKFELPIADRFTLDMPRAAEIVSVMVQRERPHLWALVDPSLTSETRHFRLAGTGHIIDEQIINHVGSFQMVGGGLVFHVFEVSP